MPIEYRWAQGLLLHSTENVQGTKTARGGFVSVRVHPIKHGATDGVLVPSGKKSSMKTIHVYDKPMCCSTGVCGPQVDPVLPQFAADLDWLKSQGHLVERFNLAQQPMEFIQNKDVHQLLGSEGTDCLPLIVVDGVIVSRKDYPSRKTLATWVSENVAKQLLPVVFNKS